MKNLFLSRDPHNSSGIVILLNVTMGQANVGDFSDECEVQVIVQTGVKLCGGTKILAKKLEVEEDAKIVANADL